MRGKLCFPISLILQNGSKQNHTGTDPKCFCRLCNSSWYTDTGILLTPNLMISLMIVVFRQSIFLLHCGLKINFHFQSNSWFPILMTGNPLMNILHRILYLYDDQYRSQPSRNWHVCTVNASCIYYKLVLHKNCKQLFATLFQNMTEERKDVVACWIVYTSARHHCKYRYVISFKEKLHSW